MSGNERIIDTIADELIRLRTVKWVAPSFAKAILDALRANRIAVVELPKMSVNGEDNAVWLNDPHVEQSFEGEVVISDRLAVSPESLRPLAAALLAAAAKAEEGQ